MREPSRVADVVVYRLSELEGAPSDDLTTRNRSQQTERLQERVSEDLRQIASLCMQGQLAVHAQTGTEANRESLTLLRSVSMTMETCSARPLAVGAAGANVVS